jgi:hypothetical protein
MSIAELADQEIAYEIIGEGRAWVVTPGGRFSKDYGGIREFAQALAERARSVSSGTVPTAASHRSTSLVSPSR